MGGLGSLKVSDVFMYLKPCRFIPCHVFLFYCLYFLAAMCFNANRYKVVCIGVEQMYLCFFNAAIFEGVVLCV